MQRHGEPLGGRWRERDVRSRQEHPRGLAKAEGQQFLLDQPAQVRALPAGLGQQLVRPAERRDPAAQYLAQGGRRRSLGQLHRPQHHGQQVVRPMVDLAGQQVHPLLGRLAFADIHHHADEAADATVRAQQDFRSRQHPANLAVRPPELELDLEVAFAARAGAAGDAAHAIHLAWQDEGVDLVPGDVRGAREAHHLLQLGRRRDLVALDLPDGHPTGVRGQPQPRRLGIALGLGHLARGDVLQGADIPRRHGLAVHGLEDRPGVGDDPAFLATGEQQPVLIGGLVADPGVERALGLGHGPDEVVRMGHRGHHVIGHRPVGGKAADRPRLGRIDHLVRRHPPFPDTDARRRGRQFQPVLAGLQRRLAGRQGPRIDPERLRHHNDGARGQQVEGQAHHIGLETGGVQHHHAPDYHRANGHQGDAGSPAGHQGGDQHGGIEQGERRHAGRDQVHAPAQQHHDAQQDQGDEDPGQQRRRRALRHTRQVDPAQPIEHVPSFARGRIWALPLPAVKRPRRAPWRVRPGRTSAASPR